ncbi:MAG: 2-hydroxyacid dehydrogenase [Verrucomicrobia bacterium]|jgi:D-lactate dehydrogenase|nr:2-hydroxyacid dehydrogenase [Verrucomicrobiota bacterium]
MKVAVFGTKPYDRQFFESRGTGRHEKTYLEPRLTPDTVSLAEGHEAVCVFVHDNLNAEVIDNLKQSGVRYVVIRAAGFNNVDLGAAARHGIRVARVPAYAPDGVAEFTVGLILSLNRGIHRAYSRIRNSNFSLDGLMGFNMRGKTVGVIGTGKIGQSVCQILLGFGCRVLAFDVHKQESLLQAGVEYRELEDILPAADILTLHVPLLPATRRMINEETLRKMKSGAMLINTSRGELIDTGAVIEALKSGRLSSLGIDVYEEEEGVFFEDLSNAIVDDDQLMRLTTFPNVILSSHQAFFTREAMENIARVTLENLDAFAETGASPNEVHAQE